MTKENKHNNPFDIPDVGERILGRLDKLIETSRGATISPPPSSTRLNFTLPATYEHQEQHVNREMNYRRAIIIPNIEISSIFVNGKEVPLYCIGYGEGFEIDEPISSVAVTNGPYANNVVDVYLLAGISLRRNAVQLWGAPIAGNHHISKVAVETSHDYIPRLAVNGLDFNWRPSDIDDRYAILTGMGPQPSQNLLTPTFNKRLAITRIRCSVEASTWTAFNFSRGVGGPLLDWVFLGRGPAGNAVDLTLHLNCQQIGTALAVQVLQSGAGSIWWCAAGGFSY